MVIAVQMSKIPSIADLLPEKTDSSSLLSVPKNLKNVGEKQAYSSRNVRRNNAKVVPAIRPREINETDKIKEKENDRIKYDNRQTIPNRENTGW